MTIKCPEVPNSHRKLEAEGRRHYLELPPGRTPKRPLKGLFELKAQKPSRNLRLQSSLQVQSKTRSLGKVLARSQKPDEIGCKTYIVRFWRSSQDPSQGTSF